MWIDRGLNGARDDTEGDAHPPVCYTCVHVGGARATGVCACAAQIVILSEEQEKPKLPFHFTFPFAGAGPNVSAKVGPGDPA